MIAHAAPGRSTARRSTDVVVIGDGVIGLSTALELARSGASCVVVGQRREGAASDAAAGLLAPSIGSLSDEVRTFFVASLDAFPAFLAPLTEFDPGLAIIRGLIDVSPDAATRRDTGKVLSAADVARLEPGVSAPFGGRLYEHDGAIDNVRLVAALRRAVAAAGIDATLDDPAVGLDLASDRATVRLESGARVDADRIVVAAGAWSTTIEGLPRPLPITPLKGQMLAVASSALSHPLTGASVYLVPRGAEVAIGATAESVGFDISISVQAIEGLRQSAATICPGLADGPVLRAWAGFRPATPDLLPIIGSDPDDARVIYACGHSKNGILLAPATAAVVSALAQSRHPFAPVDAFSVTRFAG